MSDKKDLKETPQILSRNLGRNESIDFFFFSYLDFSTRNKVKICELIKIKNTPTPEYLNFYPKVGLVSAVRVEISVRCQKIPGDYV